jgi:hypothetical protein
VSLEVRAVCDIDQGYSERSSLVDKTTQWHIGKHHAKTGKHLWQNWQWKTAMEKTTTTT